MQSRAKKIDEITALLKNITFKHFKDSFKEFRKLGIHPGQVMIIKMIDEKKGTKQKELVNVTKREKATITKALQRLEKRDFIKRINEDTDKRSTTIFLTAKGIKLKKSINNLKSEQMSWIENVLSEEDLDNFLKILNKIKSGMEEDYEKNI